MKPWTSRNTFASTRKKRSFLGSRRISPSNAIDSWDVIIAGGGPCGLMLAIELGRRGIRVLLVDAKASTATNPQANATQARTMEHYRRLGFAEEIRALGLPPDFPTDVAYFTRFATHELARFQLPSAREARKKITGLTGSWSAAELPHRVSQKFVERVIRSHAESLPGVSINYSHRLIAFTDHGTHVEAEIERLEDGAVSRKTARFIVGADGARSTVRKQLGIEYAGERGAKRDFLGGQMLALYLNCPAFYDTVGHAPAWMNVTVNPERRAFMAAVNGKGEFAFHTQLRQGEDAARFSHADLLNLFHTAVGAPVAAEILAHGTWLAGAALVAERFRSGNAFIAGDAAHLFTTTGGLGYNTAVDDAVNLGWKLAAAVRGNAGPAILDSYEIERQPLAVRNTSYARHFADSIGNFLPPPDIEGDSAEGEAARAEAGSYLLAHAKAEFNIPGVTFGARYDGSPIIVGDGTAAPPDTANVYVPTATPGGRAPHLWLDAGRSLYDVFGFDWTLLRLGAAPPDAEPFRATAAALGMNLAIVDVATDEARDLYGADLALIRPDQVIAWRGESALAAASVLSRVSGRGS